MDDVVGARTDGGAAQAHLGQYFTGELGELSPDSWGSVEDNSRAEDAIEDVNDRVPDKGSGATVVLLDLLNIR